MRRRYTCLASLLSLCACNQKQAQTKPATEAQPAQFVSVSAGTELLHVRGGSIILKRDELFEALPSSPVVMPLGSTKADKDAVEAARRQLVEVRLPFAHYWVPSTKITWTSKTSRGLQAASAVELFAAIEDAVGRASAEAYCSRSRDVLAEVAKANVLPDEVALDVLDSAAVDAAEYSKIAALGKDQYVRLPEWGKPAGGHCS